MAEDAEAGRAAAPPTGDAARRETLERGRARGRAGRWLRRGLVLAALAGVVGLGARDPQRSRRLARRGWAGFKRVVFAIRPRPAAPAARARTLPAVHVQRRAPLRHARVREYFGEIEAIREARLAFEVAGRVRTMHVRENMAVDPARPLAELDPTLFEARRDRAQAQRVKAERDVKRNRDLRRDRAIAPRLLEDAETALLLSQTAVREATEQLARTRLFAPFAGYVVERHIELGELARPGEPAFRVMQLDPVELVVWVPEYRVTELRKGQPAAVLMPAFPGRALRGEVARVPLSAERRGRLFAVRVRLANTDHAIRPGMIGRARITTAVLAGVWRLPIEWVRRDVDGPWVLAMRRAPTAPDRGTVLRLRLADADRDGSHWIAAQLIGADGRAVESPPGGLRFIAAGGDGLEPGSPVSVVAAADRGR